MKNKDIILGLLYEKNLTGYEINEIFKQIFSHFYDASFGMIYPTLRKLSDKGLVEKKVVVQEGRPNKNVYILTEDGKKEFINSLNTKLFPEVRRSDFLMRMYFGEHFDNKKVINLINCEIEDKKKLIDQLKNNLNKWNNMSLTQEISFKVGINQYMVEIETLQEYIKKLSEK
ncbi:PadR family transcriptional regulator [Fructilactobacillus vespulae]|uniref:PadR family transcriptional regulator n=1 Tax=Fructilactobacillus vespulae TaxID=1249630 RepID=UPI0039B3DF5D